MILSAAELSAAKDATGALLDELGLEAYLYEVELEEDAWRIRVDCATMQGWQSLSVTVDKQTLLASPNDPAARSRLTEILRERLSSQGPDGGS